MGALLSRRREVNPEPPVRYETRPKDAEEGQSGHVVIVAPAQSDRQPSIAEIEEEIMQRPPSQRQLEVERRAAEQRQLNRTSSMEMFSAKKYELPPLTEDKETLQRITAYLTNAKIRSSFPTDRLRTGDTVILRYVKAPQEYAVYAGRVSSIQLAFPHQTAAISIRELQLLPINMYNIGEVSAAIEAYNHSLEGVVVYRFHKNRLLTYYRRFILGLFIIFMILVICNVFVYMYRTG